VRVAGAESILERDRSVQVSVPFASAYRVIASEPLVMDGRLVSSGDVVQVGAGGAYVTRLADAGNTVASLKLVIAEARPAPVAAPSSLPLFKNF
jgi:hypothetical protein